MGSWIACPCGAHLHTNLFTGTGVCRMIRDSDYDAVEDPVGRDKLEQLFLRRGIPVYHCGQCGRLAVEWPDGRGLVFYAPQADGTPPGST